MLAYAIFVTFALGCLVGAVSTILIAQRTEKETDRRLSIHPSGRNLDFPMPFNILDYDKK